MKTDISRLDEKPRMLSTSRGLTWFGGVVVAAAIAASAGFAGLEGCDQGWDAEAGQSEVRVVRASVTWQEGGRELSVVHVDEPVRETAPRVVRIGREERRARSHGDPRIVGREIRTGVAAVTMLMRLLASGKMGG